MAILPLVTCLGAGGNEYLEEKLLHHSGQHLVNEEKEINNI